MNRRNLLQSLSAVLVAPFVGRAKAEPAIETTARDYIAIGLKQHASGVGCETEAANVRYWTGGGDLSKFRDPANWTGEGRVYEPGTVLMVPYGKAFNYTWPRHTDT